MANFALSDNAQEYIVHGSRRAPLYANKGDEFLLATWGVLPEYPQCTARNAVHNNIEHSKRYMNRHFLCSHVPGSESEEKIILLRKPINDKLLIENILLLLLR